MKRAIRLVLPAATLLVAFFAANGLVFANKEMAKKTLDGAPAPAK
jgi:hypothetical protein